MMEREYDVAVVGASVAGCTAAILFARRGAAVALIERKNEMDAYKKICTHFIQPSATPTIKRLGLAPLIETAGGLRNEIEVWTRWGWIIPPQTANHPYGYNIRREKLDPMLRRLAAETDGVDFMPGRTAQQLLIRKGRVSGALVAGADGVRRDIRARLVIGADGRHSHVAELAGLTTTVKRNERFAYFAYYRDVPFPRGARSRMWFLEPDMAYTFPNDDGITLACAMPVRAKLERWKADVEGSTLRLFASLPNAPPLHQGRRISPFLGVVEAPDRIRELVRPGLALVGDAALSSDPLWGVGCGWALQSAEWLADAVGDAFRHHADVDHCLQDYRRRHRRQLAGHEYLIADFATGRSYNPIDRLMLSAAARDPVCAEHLFAFASRSIGVGAFLAPGALARAAWVNARHLVAPKGRVPDDRLDAMAERGCGTQTREINDASTGQRSG